MRRILAEPFSPDEYSFSVYATRTLHFAGTHLHQGEGGRREKRKAFAFELAAEKYAKVYSRNSLSSSLSPFSNDSLKIKARQQGVSRRVVMAKGFAK